jgi:hypothetical protein
LYLRGTSIFLGDGKIMFQSGKLFMNTDKANNYDVASDVEMPDANEVKNISSASSIPFVIALGGM